MDYWFELLDLPMLRTLKIGCGDTCACDNTFGDCCSIVFESRQMSKTQA